MILTTLVGNLSAESETTVNDLQCNWLGKYQRKQIHFGIWVFPKIMVPPNHPFLHRVFHYFHHSFWGFYSFTPIFGSTPIYYSVACCCFSDFLEAAQL